MFTKTRMASGELAELFIFSPQDKETDTGEAVPGDDHQRVPRVQSSRCQTLEKGVKCMGKCICKQFLLLCETFINSRF